MWRTYGTPNPLLYLIIYRYLVPYGTDYKLSQDYLVRFQFPLSATRPGLTDYPSDRFTRQIYK